LNLLQVLELRCFCSNNTLLAVCGKNEKTGELFVHVKHRQGRSTSEALFTGGQVKLRCHACGRWYRVKMRDRKVALEPDS
jgi:hypothetical protein